MKFTVHTWLGTTALALGLTGCPAEPEALATSNDLGESTSADTQTIARVDFSDGRSVSFLELEPGLVITSERGPIGAAPLYDRNETRGMNPAQLYAYLADEPAPEALLTAVAIGNERSARVSEAPSLRTLAEPETLQPKLAALQSAASSDGIGVSAQALSNGLTTQTFKEEFCPPDGEFFSWINVTGTGSITRSDVNEFHSAVMATRGTVHWVLKWRRWYTWKDTKNIDVPAGWYDNVSWGWSDLDYDVRTTVSQAEGDLYNMCTQVHK